RATAARYLRDLSTWMPEPTRADLLAAAAQYELTSTLVAQPLAGDFSPSMLFPWRLGSLAAWKSEHRKAQGDVLRTAVLHEQEAVASLGNALKELGVLAGGDHAIG